MAKYKTVRNMVNLYDQNERVIDYLPEGKTLDISQIVKVDGKKEIGILKDGTFIITKYEGQTSVKKMETKEKKTK